jgi:hypothetical protein
MARQLAFDKVTLAVYKARLARLKGELADVGSMIARTSPQYMWRADNVERMSGILAEFHERRDTVIRKIQGMKRNIGRLRLKLHITVDRHAAIATEVRNYEVEHLAELSGFWARAIAAPD